MDTVKNVQEVDEFAVSRKRGRSRMMTICFLIAVTVSSISTNVDPLYPYGWRLYAEYIAGFMLIFVPTGLYTYFTFKR